MNNFNNNQYMIENRLDENDSTTILTVIIFTYNHEDYIAKAVDSVLEQETTYSFEVWICDDCSNDDTTTICNNYANNYPEKIKLFAQPVNTYSSPGKVTHVETTLKMVNTKYFCLLDGDDAWCDNKKIQIALDFLENNPEYITFAHDTLINDVVNKTKRSLVHEVYSTEIQNPVTFENVLYLHTSSRIHRNVARFSENPDSYTDIFLFYIFLDKGPLYYYDKIMSVYNITGKGAWSSLSDTDAKTANSILQYKLNKFFDYKHDSFFTSRIGEPKTLELLKSICGNNLGWELWYILISKDVHIIEKENRLADFANALQLMGFDEIWKQLRVISDLQFELQKTQHDLSALQLELQKTQHDLSALQLELQKTQHDMSALYLILSRMPLASEEPTVEKVEENIQALNEYYRSKEIPDVILLFEKTSKIHAHLVAVSLCLRNGLRRKALSHLVQIGKMDPVTLVSIQTLKIIINGLTHRMSRA